MERRGSEIHKPVKVRPGKLNVWPLFALAGLWYYGITLNKENYQLIVTQSIILFFLQIAYYKSYFSGYQKTISFTHDQIRGNNK